MAPAHLVFCIKCFKGAPLSKMFQRYSLDEVKYKLLRLPNLPPVLLSPA